MAQRKDIMWKLQRHTKAKHAILAGYLDAWIPILGSWAEHLVLIDGFAGPGRYIDREPGSPLLMLDAYLRRSDRDKLKAQLHFVFIEADEHRFEHLKGELAKRKPQPKVEITLLHGDFSDRFPTVLASVKQRFGEQPPTFAFIDPFGADDTAHRLTTGLIKLPRCEALIYVPITHLARFVTEADLEPTLVNLYGGRSWEPARKTTNLEMRRQILQDAFRARLRESCQWVRWFEIVPEVGKNSYSLRTMV